MGKNIVKEVFSQSSIHYSDKLGKWLLFTEFSEHAMYEN